MSIYCECERGCTNDKHRLAWRRILTRELNGGAQKHLRDHWGLRCFSAGIATAIVVTAIVVCIMGFLITPTDPLVERYQQAAEAAIEEYRVGTLEREIEVDVKWRHGPCFVLDVGGHIVYTTTATPREFTHADICPCREQRDEDPESLRMAGSLSPATLPRD